MTIIETRGVEHRIEFRVDHVNNEPKITHTTAPSSIDVGTKITIKWPRQMVTARWQSDATSSSSRNPTSGSIRI